MAIWPFKKRIGQRRLEVRRSIPSASAAFRERLGDTGGIGALMLALALLLGVVVMDVWPVDPFPWRLGQYVPNDIHVRNEFKVLLPVELEAGAQRAANNTSATFQLNAARVDAIIRQFKRVPESIGAATQPADVPAAGLGKVLDLYDSNEAFLTWRRYGQDESSEDFARRLKQLRKSIAEGVYIVDSKEFKRQFDLDRKQVILRAESFVVSKPLEKLISTYDIDKNPEPGDRIAEEARRLAEVFDEPVRAGAARVLTKMLGESPIYVYDKDRSEDAAQAAAAEFRANPPRECYDYFKVDRVIAKATRDRRQDRSAGLTLNELRVLRLEHVAYINQQGWDQPWNVVGRVSARTFVLMLIVLMLCIYVLFYQRRIATNRLRALAVVLTILLTLAATKVLTSVFQLNPYVCMLPVLMAVVIITIAYDQRWALGFGMVISVLAVMQIRADFGMLVLLMVAVGVSVYQLDEIRTRSKLIRVLGISSVSVFVATLCYGVMRAVPVSFVFIDSIWAGASTLLVGFLVQGTLPIIERVFRIATSMTLLEWCDASKPLMRRLAMEAPGTHNHSLQLGSMCEAAAAAIGARGLLARVGAYYHDIGKINKADYFVENRGAAPSKHEKLSPEMSLLIIVGHVKDGIELAREYGLPPVLHEFIATHHGTTLVRYFYDAAMNRTSDDGREPDEVEYRYSGPKPRTREAAILMLADASESSVRAMSEPTPGRIEDQVHTMVTRRLTDGQLDDCDLTLREVHQIEASLIKSLCGVYHARIAYPTPKGEKPSPAEIPANGDAPKDSGNQ